jgi:hypothetical protein
VPLHWIIDSRQKLVTLTAEGEVSRADADQYLEAVEHAAAVGYRKLIDWRAANVAMVPEDVMAVGVRIRSFHGGSVGALAVVLADDRSEAVARILGILATADRPIRIFTSMPPAQRWIDTLPESREARCS